jgi:CDP-diglyceride synthetase
MEHNQHPQPGSDRDQQIWLMAKRRVGFKNHLAVYLVVNALLWGIWLFTSKDNKMWPLYTTLGWGVGLAMHFASVYIFPKEDSVEREYEKLMRNKK